MMEYQLKQAEHARHLKCPRCGTWRLLRSFMPAGFQMRCQVCGGFYQ